MLFTNLAGLWFKELSSLNEDIYGSSPELTAEVVRALRYPTFTVGAEPRERHHHVRSDNSTFSREFYSFAEEEDL